jgi:crotonobetainyl-CoA:carnitine CoA-transferase CaiB-like acyl-CoA transferase
MLGDLGAEVIKIERPGAGDDTRGWGPPYLRDHNGVETTESAYFLCANRNKKSVTVDMTHPEGRRLLVRLAQASDILIENFKARARLRHPACAESAPDLLFDHGVRPDRSLRTATGL